MLSKKGRYKIFFLLLIAACIMWIGAPGNASAADYYVAVTGNDDTGTGESANPWATLYHAVSSLTSGGHTIHLMAGTYDVTHEGDAFYYIGYSDITIQGESPGNVILDGFGGADWSIGISADMVDNITIRGLVIRNFTSAGISIYMGTGSVIQNCIFYNNPIGISVADSDPEISSNVLYDNTTGMEIVSYTTNASLIQNNLIFNGISSTMDTAIGVFAYGSAGCTMTAMIYHNTLVNGNVDGINLYDMGCDLFNPAIKYNIIAGFTQFGINRTSTETADIDYNDNYNTTNFASGLTGGANDISDNPQFSNAAAYDFHMTIDSPCVDVIPSAENTVSVDLDGYSRPQGDAKDMGCYEFLPEPADVTNQPPDTPTALSPADLTIISTSSVILRTSAFSDPDDGDTHTTTTWKVWRDDQDEMNTVYYNVAENSAGLTAQIVTDLQTGMRYVWKAGYADSAGEISWSAESRFTVGTVTTQYGDIPAGSEIADYRMYSIPKWMDTALCKALFGHLPVEKYNTGLVRVGTYDPKTGGYIECGADLKPQPGQAFWLLIRKGISLPVTGIHVTRDVGIERKLAYNTTTQNGWNMIACPNAKRYKWQDIIVVVKDIQGSTAFGPFLVSELEDNTYIDRRIWDWNEGTYVSYNNSSDFMLWPTYGYWVKVNMENVSLIFEGGELVSDAVDQHKTFSHALHELIADAKAWLKKALDYPKPAIADDADITPPMPMGIYDAETPDDKCFIMSLM